MWEVEETEVVGGWERREGRERKRKGRERKGRGGEGRKGREGRGEEKVGGEEEGWNSCNECIVNFMNNDNI